MTSPPEPTGTDTSPTAGSPSAFARWRRRPLGAGDRFGGFLFGLFGLMGVYSVVAVFTAQTATALAVLPTPVDELVSFFPASIFVYFWLYPQVVTPLVLVTDRRVLLRGAFAYGCLVAFAVPFWLMWPVTVPRESVPVVDLTSWGVALLRSLDPPTNCFPSMHVAGSFLAALLARRHSRLLGSLLTLSAVAVWWSTMALEQHWFVDGLVGLVLAVVVNHLVFAWRPLPASAFGRGRERQFGWIVLLYLVLVAVAAAPWFAGWMTGADLPERW
jgi:membrane-associated phospholipid phosphatase